VVNPDLKLFVGDSLAGNDTVSQAREFHNYTKFDGAILTKSDADARGGAAISIVKITSSPILYLGVGQEYKDLKPFDKDIFLESIFGQQESMPEIQQKEKPMQQPEREEFEEKSLKKQEQQVEIKEVKPEVIETKPIQPPVTKIEIKTEKEVTVKPELKIEPKPEPKIKQGVKTKPVEEIPEDDDPFAGIETKDIEKYSNLYDVSPPDTDDEARKLAAKIRRWVSDGRPKSTKEDKKDVIEEEIDEVSEDEKPKKKRSIFGWIKK